VTKTKQSFLADKIAGMICETAIFVTKDEHVLTNNKGDVSHISPCNHEEADSRIFLHAKDAAINGSNSIMIVSSDTDVVVIGISLFAQLEVEQLWIAFGKGKDFRWVSISIHDIAKTLGPRARTLPFFHAFSGCDTVSAFTGKGKKSCWQAWNVFPDETEVFSRLSTPIDNVGSDCLDIEAFVVIMYD
jgi:hypothetical protein